MLNLRGHSPQLSSNEIRSFLRKPIGIDNGETRGVHMAHSSCQRCTGERERDRERTLFLSPRLSEKCIEIILTQNLCLSLRLIGFCSFSSINGGGSVRGVGHTPRFYLLYTHHSLPELPVGSPPVAWSPHFLHHFDHRSPAAFTAIPLHGRQSGVP